MGNLVGKIALITGSGGGIGAAIAEEFARKGITIILSDIDDIEVKKVYKKISFYGVRIESFKCDVGNSFEVKNMIGKILNIFSTIDILVNCAGIMFPPEIIENIQESEWDEVMRVNLRGVFNCCRAIIGIMKKNGAGKIINIASSAGKTGGVKARADYSVSKAGVICFTKVLAKELAPYGINVNGIAPGITNTNMINVYSEDEKNEIIKNIPLKRICNPEEVAKLVSFLVSSDAGYITGEIIDINGGMIMD